MVDSIRFNGALVPHRNQPNVFADNSGDRMWAEPIPALGMIQFWAYEEEDGERGEAFSISTVALDMDGIKKLKDYLTRFEAQVAAKKESVR